MLTLPPMPELYYFIRFFNPDKSRYSICRRCSKKVAQLNSEAELRSADQEHEHVCHPLRDRRKSSPRYLSYNDKYPVALKRQSISIESKPIVSSTSSTEVPQIAFPSDDMPPDVKSLYEAAHLVSRTSPKTAAALLHLAIKQLCLDFDVEENNFRVAHSKLTHTDDASEIIDSLFALVNVFVRDMITRPARVKKRIEALPQEIRKQVDRRRARLISSSALDNSSGHQSNFNHL